jgi:hypothetical protein
MSGYSAELLKDNCLAEPQTHFLPKPYSSQALADAVRASLDATAHWPNHSHRMQALMGAATE